MQIRLESGAGPGSKIGTELLVDPLRGALRASLGPLDAADTNGNILGFYRAGAVTGALTGAGAGSAIFSARWTSPSAVAVILRVSMHHIVTTAYTTAQLDDYDLTKLTGFSVSDSAGTPITPSKMRSTHAASLMADLRISSTAALTAGTKTADANPIGYAVFPNNNTLSNAATTWVGAPFVDLYKLDAMGVQHPLVLGPNEGFNIRPITAMGAVGVVKLYIVVEWAELPQF